MREDRGDRDEELEEEADRTVARRPWDRNSFLTGLVLGAAVGAGLALLLAPASGEDTRRILRKRTRALARDAESGFASARKEARRSLREKKEALRGRLEQGLEKLGDELGV